MIRLQPDCREYVGSRSGAGWSVRPSGENFLELGPGQGAPGLAAGPGQPRRWVDREGAQEAAARDDQSAVRAKRVRVSKALTSSGSGMPTWRQVRVSQTVTRGGSPLVTM